jgi:CHASE3 domain sensor protein
VFSQSIRPVPFDLEMELAVIDRDGPHALVFPCRLTLRRAAGRLPSAPRTGDHEATIRWQDSRLRPLYSSLGATSAVAALVVGATIWLSAATQSQNDWARHTLAVRNQISQILSLVQSAETGQRGYLLTNSQAYLIPYDRGTAAVGAAIDEPGRLVIDNPKQEQSVGRLRELFKAKLDELVATIEDQKSGRTDRAIATVKSDDGLRLMMPSASFSAPWTPLKTSF